MYAVVGEAEQEGSDGHAQGVHQQFLCEGEGSGAQASHCELQEASL